MQSKIYTRLSRLAFTVVWLALTFSSCIPNRKMIYFPDPNIKAGEITQINNVAPVYRLQPRDVLSVNIKTTDPQSSSYFNIQPEGSLINFNPGIGYLNGYSIDENGFIRLPELGKVKVGGLTLSETHKVIEDKLSGYLNNATILVKLVSFKITVLGEVKNPGHYYIYNDQSTVLECLGMAGDLTDFGNRENITLVRQQATGPGATLINLKDPGTLASPYYYVQPNDVIYVQPLRGKATRGNLGALGILSVVAGVVSTAILVLNFVGR